MLHVGFPAQGRKFPESDARTFQALTAEYGTDRTHVYYQNQAVDGAEPTTFTYLAGSYAKDHKRSYCQGQPISDDGSAFVIVPNPEETLTHVTAGGTAYTPATIAGSIRTLAFLAESTPPRLRSYPCLMGCI
ncbi:DKNYY domain-containing protein [Spirosoma fluminis]